MSVGTCGGRLVGTLSDGRRAAGERRRAAGTATRPELGAMPCASAPVRHRRLVGCGRGCAGGPWRPARSRPAPRLPLERDPILLLIGRQPGIRSRIGGRARRCHRAARVACRRDAAATRAAGRRPEAVGARRRGRGWREGLARSDLGALAADVRSLRSALPLPPAPAAAPPLPSRAWRRHREAMSARQGGQSGVKPCVGQVRRGRTLLNLGPRAGHTRQQTGGRAFGWAGRVQCVCGEGSADVRR